MLEMAVISLDLVCVPELPIPLTGATMNYSSMRPFCEAEEEARERLRADHRPGRPW